MKKIAKILSIIIFGLLLHSQLAHAEIFKWVDEKGTVHFTEDPATIPEKYMEKTKSRNTEEMTMEEKIRGKQEQEKRTIRDQRESERYLEGENRRKAKKEFEDTLYRMQLKHAYKECANCNGKGYILREVMESMRSSDLIEVTCPICNGTGYVRK